MKTKQINIPKKSGTKIKNRKWTKQQILKEYMALYKTIGNTLSMGQLNAMGRSDLSAAIKNHFKSNHNFYNQAGVPIINKSKYYWTKNNTSKELRIFCDEHRELIENTSFYNALEKHKRSDLEHAVCYWGGIKNLNIELNLHLKIRRKKWTEQDIIEELTRLKLDGIAITQSSLKALNKQDLLGAIDKFGTLSEFKAALGLPIKRNRYWTKEKIEQELKSLFETNKFLPNRAMLFSIGRSDLASAISKKGGMKAFADSVKIKPSKYYLSNNGNWLHSSYELFFQNILIKYSIPHKTQVQICPNYKYTADFAIQNTFIEIVGYNEQDHPEYYINLEKKLSIYKEENLRHYIITKKTFSRNIKITESRIIDLLIKLFPELDISLPVDYTSHIHSVKKDLKIFSDFEKTKIQKSSKLNHNVKNILPSDYWADIENIKKELLPLVEKYGRMPKDSEFRKEKKASLIGGIYKHFGNFYELGQKLNIPVYSKPKNFYNRETILQTYKSLCIQKGKFLTHIELQSEDSGLASVINNHYSMYDLRNDCKLSFSHIREPYTIYTPEKAIAEYKILCLQQRSFLSKKELYSLGKKTLGNYIAVHIGFNKIYRLTALLEHPEFAQKYYTREKAIEEYKNICSDKGYFLTKKEVKLATNIELEKYIQSKIGWRKIKSLCYVNLPSKPIDKSFNLDTANERYLTLCKEHGYLLSEKSLKKLGEIKLARFIQQQISFHEIKKNMTAHGLKTLREISIVHSNKSKYDKAVLQFKKICRKNNRFLNLKELEQMGENYLAGVIKRNGGLVKICLATELSFPLKYTRSPIVLDDIVNEYKKLCLKKGVYLCSSELLKMGYAKLDNSILHKCGYRKLRELTGLNYVIRKKVKQKGFTVAYAVKEFRKLSIKNKAFFSRNDFTRVGAVKLAGFIGNNGGYRRFQKLSGLSIKKYRKSNQPGR